jgi:hypothetical protein
MGNVNGAVHRKENPNAAPAWAYVPIAEGSSLAAPLISPGSSDLSNERALLDTGTRIGPGALAGRSSSG